MTDPRYPNGPFRSVQRPLTAEERAEKIAAIEAHPERMSAALEGLDDTQLDTPYRDGGWTVRQVVHHVVDSHLNSYVRFKQAATAENPAIQTYDQDAWAALSDGRDGPVDMSLDILSALHRRWVAFLNGLEPEAFQRTTYHPEWGDITIDVLLEIYAWHGAHHEAHVTSLREANGW